MLSREKNMIFPHWFETCHNKPPHLYGLSEIHKPYIPLRPIAPVAFLVMPLQLLHQYPGPFSWQHGLLCQELRSLYTIQEINLQNEDSLVTFDAVSLFKNITVEEVLGTIPKRCCSIKCMKENTLLNSTERFLLL
jgi:hypothetical protein